MKDQFFGITFWIAFVGLALSFGLAVLVFETPAIPFILATIVIICTLLTFRRTEIGLLIAFAELFGNSHGHLISTDIGGVRFGLRMAIFAGVMAGWGIAFVLKRAKIDWRDSRLVSFLPLFLAVVIGFVIGVENHPKGDAFADGNSYVYLAYLFPVLSVHWDSPKRRALLQVLAAGALWISALTLGLFFVFSHVPEFMLGETYRFIRDTRTGELTKMIEGIFRVFLQGQFSAMALLMLVLPGFWLWKLSRREWLQTLDVCAVLIATIFLSLSRSFWIAGIAGGLICIGLLLFRARISGKTLLAGIGRGVFAKLAAALFILIVLFFPYPHYRSGTFGGFASLFSSRTTDISDAAIDSRWKLLAPMREMIARRPLFGYGFGQTVTFITDDPRIRAMQPDGHYETYSLEWGWFELWLKMGLLGPVAFLFLIFRLAKGFFLETKSPQGWLAIGFLSALAMLAATHMFSPYLNHPIGLGFLLFAVAFLPNQKPSPGKGTGVPVEIVLEKPRVQAKVVPAMSE